MAGICRAALPTVVALVVVAGCSLGGSDRPAVGDPVAGPGGRAGTIPLDARWESDDTYEALASRTVDGALPAEAALQLFALQYGELPGVDLPDGRSGPAREGDLAVSAVLAVWSDLTDGQRAAIRAALDLPADVDPGDASVAGDPDPAPATVPGGSGPSAAVPASVVVGGGRVGTRSVTAPSGVRMAVAAGARRDGPGAAPYRRAMAQVQPVIERHLGALAVPVTIEVVARSSGRTPLADTIVLDRAPSGSTCRIRVFSEAFPPPDGPSITLAHELVHCYQWLWRSGGGAPWAREGTAEWAAMTAVAEAGRPAADADLADEFAEYYETPGRRLFDRTYDAVGWWAHLGEQGGDVWGAMRAVITSASSPAAYRAASAGAGEGLISEWGTSQLDGTGFGPRWVIAGPGVPTVPNAISVRTRLGNGDSVEAASPAYASARTGRVLVGDLLRVSVADGTAGYLRVDGGDRPLAELTGTTWCTSPSGNCVCPPGTRRAGERFARLGSGPTVVGLSAGGAAGSATLTAVSLEQECERQANCLVGTWAQDGPPANDLFTTLSGGGGATVVFADDGRVTFDFSTMQPWRASPRSDPSGVITARLGGTGTGRAHYPDPPSGSAVVTVTDVEAASVTGTATMQVGGVEVGSIGGDLVRELWGAVDGASWTVASCERDTMRMGSGPNLATYSRVA